MSPLWIILTLLPILGGAARFNCKGRILGAYYADAKSGCKAFHVCVRVAGGGIRDFRFFCPPGTLFHQEAQTCTDWGDDDPLACPADLYDGQFDLYKIGSGFDTKKASIGNREEESDFGLQRAETGDRRLSQNNGGNTQNNDLRAAHSSDFFSGQRERGRDEAQSQRPASQSHARQSFRRATTPRAPPTTTQSPTTPPPQPTYQPQYEVSKRKLIRKRPVQASSPAPQSTLAQNTPQFQEPQPFQESQNYNRRPSQQQQSPKQPPTTTPYVPPQYKEYKDEYVEVPRVTPKPNRYYPANPTPLPSSHATSQPQYNNKNKKDSLVELFNYDAQSTPGLSTKQDKPFKVKHSFSVTDIPTEDFARIRPSNKNNFNNKNNNFNNDNNNLNKDNNNLNNKNSNDFNSNNFNNKNTNNFNNENKNFNNYNNNFNNFNGANRAPTTTVDYNSSARTTTNTPNYKNFNSVSYEPEKNNFVQFSKQTNNPTTIPTTTTIYTTYRPDHPQNLNTVAYDTNNGFHSQSNFAEPSEEDDGQYRPPQGEDDGQYRPELYGDRELLSGAHSLNIAASGNRLPEDQKQKSYSKTKAPPKFVSQTAAPRPFRPAPSSPQSTFAPEPTTTVAPQTQRTFDLFQTYTTTSRPTDFTGGAPDFVPINNAPASRPTTSAPRAPETRPPRPQPRPAQAPTFPPYPAPRPTTQPSFSKPVNKKEDNSYDYAYYDSDPGFSEYDQIEDFGRTKKRA